MSILQKYTNEILIKKEYIIVSIISLFIFIIGIQITPGLTVDSLRYISVAEKIVTEGALYPIEVHSSSYASYATTISPPLFEYLISAFLLLGFEKLTAGGMVSLLFLALLPFPIYYLAKEVNNRKIGYLSILFMISMVSTWYVGTYVWTEMTFTFLSLSSLYYCIKYININRTRNLLLCSIFCMLSCLTRWFGIILGISIFLVFLYRHYTENRPSRVVLLLYSIISFSPVSILLLRNILFKRSVYPTSGLRVKFLDIFIVPIGSILMDFFYPFYMYFYKLILLIYHNKISISSINLNFNFIYSLAILVSIILFILLIRLIIKFIDNYRSIKDKILLCKRKIVILPVILYLVLYLLGLMFLKCISSFDPLGTRFLFPVYPLIIIIFFYLYNTMISCLYGIDKLQVKKCFFAFVILFLLFQSIRTSYLLIYQKDGKGYSSPEVKSFTTSNSFIFLKSN
ncbi:hypothetical protein MSBRW_3322 [Methanosarcina barkeri str. Wiesmoor]|uniref:Glycosyltransferase RgtA/B/C/D-like domain-containing protein n=2 Tax=Methanosarcina barkeri TaxID=2208 RepID=A0A0E3QPW6_METBA|nr:hypothetical protein MSBRW_3322 [Methanosarcina barkeri str. Wiesmoor]